MLTIEVIFQIIILMYFSWLSQELSKGYFIFLNIDPPIPIRSSAYLSPELRRLNFGMQLKGVFQIQNCRSSSYLYQELELKQM